MRSSLFLLLAGCGSLYSDLGDDDLDTVALAAIPAFAHIEEALGSEAVTVADLLALGSKDLEWSFAPDPSPYLDATYADHQALPPLSGATITLRVLTYNAGLLDRGYLGGRTEVPEIETRREQGPDLLLSDDWDVLLLQEVWEWEDVERFEEAADAHGYTLWAGSEKVHEETGVLILIRDGLREDVGLQTEHQYEAQYGLEHWPGPNLRRGWVAWSAPIAGRTVHLLSTHLTSYYYNWEQRTAQARELGRYIASLPEDDLVIFAGDLNAGPYYPTDTWVDGEDEAHEDWFDNTLMYPTLLHYSGGTDAMVAGIGSDEIALYDLVSGGGDLQVPYGDPSVCLELVPSAFTASDCNSLYFESYAGTEFPARLDHQFFRDLVGETRVVDVEWAYTQRMDFGASGEHELSDHYGMGVTYEILRR